MSFQFKPVNTAAKFSEGRLFNVFVRTRTVHYVRSDIKRVTFEPPNVIFIQLIGENDKLYCCHLVNYSDIRDSVK